MRYAGEVLPASASGLVGKVLAQTTVARTGMGFPSGRTVVILVCNNGIDTDPQCDL